MSSLLLKKLEALNEEKKNLEKLLKLAQESDPDDYINMLLALISVQLSVQTHILDIMLTAEMEKQVDG